MKAVWEQADRQTRLKKKRLQRPGSEEGTSGYLYPLAAHPDVTQHAAPYLPGTMEDDEEQDQKI